MALGDVLGQAKAPTLLVVALAVFYIALSTPRRLLDGQRVTQARESVLISAAARACLTITGSRPRTIMLLRSRDATIAKTLTEAGRKVLLGEDVESAVASSSRGLPSYSAAAALRSVASMGPDSLATGDEETRGLAASSELSRETKLPIFMTVCFFTPIMLLLFAVFLHAYDPGSLAELVAFEFITVDLAFFLSASDRGPG